jgi:hypothetical protein
MNTKDGPMEPIKRAVRLIRPVRVRECPWLEEDLPVGKVVYVYWGPVYGCIGESGIAVTEEPNKLPFFEVPVDAVQEVPR